MFCTFKSDTTGFKYFLLPVDSDSKTFKFLHKCIKETSLNDFKAMYKVSSVDIFEVVERNSDESNVQKRCNPMFFHGTNCDSSVGILKNGFKNSERGFFGAGLYMTECFDVAIGYSECKSWPQTSTFVYVNEVLTSEDPKTHTFSFYSNIDDVEKPLESKFCKHRHFNSPDATSNDYKWDEIGRKYRKTGLSKWSACDEFVADSSLVKPRYLIRLEAKANEDVLNKYLNFVLDYI